MGRCQRWEERGGGGVQGGCGGMGCAVTRPRVRARPGGMGAGAGGGVTRMVAARLYTEMLFVQNRISIPSD